jgi:hypothetical protein
MNWRAVKTFSFSRLQFWDVLHRCRAALLENFKKDEGSIPMRSRDHFKSAFCGESNWKHVQYIRKAICGRFYSNNIIILSCTSCTAHSESKVLVYSVAHHGDSKKRKKKRKKRQCKKSYFFGRDDFRLFLNPPVYCAAICALVFGTQQVAVTLLQPLSCATG